MSQCNHENCGREHRIWMPCANMHYSEVVLHPYCRHCGLVKNLSDDQAHGLGYWINILSRISKIFALKKVQKRLIAKELESNDCFDDSYGVTGAAQKDLFVKTLKKYTKIDLKNIDSYCY